MLEYFRERMGPLLWVTLVMVIGGFVFMTDYGPGEFRFSKPLILIDDEQINEKEVYSYIRLHYPSIDLGNIDRIKADLDEAYQKGADNKTIQDLQERQKRTVQALDFIATEMVWDRVMKEDGIEVSQSVALGELKKNPFLAQRIFGPDAKSALEGHISPRTAQRLTAFGNQLQQEIHTLMYGLSVTTPVSLSYTMGGFHQASLATTADLVTLESSAFSSMTVTSDMSVVEDFYEQYKELEEDETSYGYKTPDRLSLTILSVASEDFVSEVDVNIQDLREHYEINKQTKWMSNEDEGNTEKSSEDKEDKSEAKPLPFQQVKADVEKDYRLTKALTKSQDHLQAAFDQWKLGDPAEKVQKDFDLKIEILTDILRKDVDELPGYEDIWQLSQAFNRSAEELSEEVITTDFGGLIYRLDSKTEGEPQEYEAIKDKVKQDWLQNEHLQAAEKALNAYKTVYDQSQDITLASEALTSDAVANDGIDSFELPQYTSLGLLDSESEPEEIKDHANLVSQLLRNVAQNGHSSNVVIDRKSGRVLLLIEKETVLGMTNKNDESFSEHYEKTNPMLTNSLMGQLQNQWRQKFMVERVKALYR